jgi:hypothetical protein
MRRERGRFVPGYLLKVEVRSRAPKLWGWALCNDERGLIVKQSADLFRHADDAWRAGQAEFGNFAQAMTRARR